MLNPEELDKVVSELASRPRHEKVRALAYRLLVEDLGADSQDIDFEKPAPEVRGRIDALLGQTVFEFKSDLRRERGDAEKGLTRYLTEREGQTGEKFVGIATDGADFIAYFLKGEGLQEVSAHKTDAESPRELRIWLQSVVATGEELPPDALTITREFGRDSLAARRAFDALGALWEEIGQTPEARLKRALWDRLLGLAYGADVGDDALFLQHTYLVVVAKAMAWEAMIETLPGNAADLLHGTAFSDLGIVGQSEPDFFDWILANEDGADLVMRTARQVARFRLHDIQVDILKALYESLIDPETRHDLGEYYTPDWLAARMVAAAVDRPLEQRVMDPACGSGTFLFHAVRAVLDAAEAAGLARAEAVRRAASNIAGIDIHPVAVIIARVTYLLALIPALRKEHPGNVTVPVYLGDALQWNLARIGEQGQQPDMLAADDTLEIYVPPVELVEPTPRRLDAATLRFPASIASDAGLFDRVLNTMIDFAERSESSADFSAWLARGTYARAEDGCILRDTYEVLHRLQKEGRNHIWGYVARNLARPVWLSSEAQKADVVIGNPPWLAFRHMKGELQERYRSEASAAKVWWSGRGTSGNDLSAYYFVRAALLYMRREGRIALVMPYAAMSRQAYTPFRNGKVARFGNVERYLQITAAWSLGPELQPLFPVPSCVLFAKEHDGATPAALPSQVSALSGMLPRRDADLTEANSAITNTSTDWPSLAVELDESPYRRIFRQGAILVPRRLILVELVSTTNILPSNPKCPLVRGRTGNHDKLPWKNVEPPQGTVEGEFLRPTLLGESIVPFRVLSPLHAIVPWDSERHELMNSRTAASRGYPRLSQWLNRTENIWQESGRGRRSLLDQYDYFRQLSVQFPLAPIRVAYTKAGTNLAAAHFEDNSAIIDHKLYWMAADSVEEARFLCGVLNSETLRAGVEGYQAKGQWGARDFDKYVFNLPIPLYDTGNDLHRNLAEAARTAEEVSKLVPVEEGQYFRSIRKRVRNALSEHGIAEVLESLVADLLG